MLRRPCSKCGSVEYPKYQRRSKRNGKYYNIMSSYCIRCNREDDKNRDPVKRKASQKRWVAKHKGHLKKYRKKYRNTDEFRRKKREYYHKSKINNIKSSNIQNSKQRVYTSSRKDYIRELDSRTVSNLSDILLYGDTLGI